MDDLFARPITLSDAAGPPPLTHRVPAQAVISELLQLQRDVPARRVPARLFGLSPLTEQTRPWYRGALGERAVGRLLTRLPEGWHVLHSVPVGTAESDIDHVVLGPGGLFTVNTKNHSGQKVWVAGRTLMVNGQKQPHIRNSEHEAARAARLLSAAVGAPVSAVPVVAVVDPASLTVREKPETVQVLTADRLVRWLKKRPTVLTPHRVAALLRVASDPRTWQTSPAPAQDPAPLLAAFTALGAEVRQARTVRRAWGMGLVGAGGVAAVAAGPTLLEAFLTRLVA